MKTTRPRKQISRLRSMLDARFLATVIADDVRDVLNYLRRLERKKGRKP